MSSCEPLSAEDGRWLLDLARAAIRHGLDHDGPPPLYLADLPEPLQALRASFVTLHLAGQLRGCIGSLEARRPLAADINHNAYAAAFRDPRFPRLDHAEFRRIDLEVSLLSPAEPLVFGSEAELLAQLQPFVDGLILEDGGRRGTFLPVVWQSLPEPVQFVEQLKLKAGLPRGHWSPSLRVWRYRTDVIV